MSRELLERISKFAQENYPTQMRGLVAEIEVELKKAELAKPVQEPKPEPMLMVNVWSDNGQSYFNVEWKRNPIYWEEGKYHLYIHPPEQPAQEPEPDYWHVVGQQGESIFVASFKEACHEHINDALIGASYYPEAEVATWVVRPLWSKPRVQPTQLTDEEILMRWAGSDTVRPVLGKNKVLRFAREIERHYKPLDT